MDETTTQQLDTTAAEGTPEAIEAAEAIVEKNMTPPSKKVEIKDVKAYFEANSVQPPLSMTGDLKPLMEKRPDGTTDMDDLKAALTPDAEGNVSYTY